MIYASHYGAIEPHQTLLALTETADVLLVQQPWTTTPFNPDQPRGDPLMSGWSFLDNIRLAPRWTLVPSPHRTTHHPNRPPRTHPEASEPTQRPHRTAQLLTRQQRGATPSNRQTAPPCPTPTGYRTRPVNVPTHPRQRPLPSPTSPTPTPTSAHQQTRRGTPFLPFHSTPSSAPTSSSRPRRPPKPS